MKGKVQLSNVHTDLVHMTDQPQWQIGLFEQKLVEWVFYYYHYVELYVNGVYLNHLMITRQTGSNGNVGIRCFMEEESQFQNEKGEKSAKKPKLSYLFCGIGASQILIGMTHWSQINSNLFYCICPKTQLHVYAMEYVEFECSAHPNSPSLAYFITKIKALPNYFFRR